MKVLVLHFLHKKTMTFCNYLNSKTYHLHISFKRFLRLTYICFEAVAKVSPHKAIVTTYKPNFLTKNIRIGYERI